MQIAHINQLLGKGWLLRQLFKRTFGGIRNIARFMLEAFRTWSLDIKTMPCAAATDRVHYLFAAASKSAR